MKMSKSRIAVLVLLAVTVVYVIALNQSMQAYTTWKNEKYPPSIRPWVDFAPFYATPQGLLIYLCGFGILFTWGFASLTKTKKPIAPVLVVILLTAYLFAVPVFATDVIHVDVYCVRDEESDTPFYTVDVVVATDEEYSESAMRQMYKTNLKIMLAGLHTQMDGVINVDFRYHYTTWDSDDSNHDTVALLGEAITETNWYWGYC